MKVSILVQVKNAISAAISHFSSVPFSVYDTFGSPYNTVRFLLDVDAEVGGTTTVTLDPSNNQTVLGAIERVSVVGSEGRDPETATGTTVGALNAAKMTAHWKQRKGGFLDFIVQGFIQAQYNADGGLVSLVAVKLAYGDDKNVLTITTIDLLEESAQLDYIATCSDPAAANQNFAELIEAATVKSRQTSPALLYGNRRPSGGSPTPGPSRSFSASATA